MDVWSSHDPNVSAETNKYELWYLAREFIAELQDYTTGPAMLHLSSWFYDAFTLNCVLLSQLSEIAEQLLCNMCALF